MSDKINLGVENVFSKDVLLPFSKRRRTGAGGRTGVRHIDLSSGVLTSLINFAAHDLYVDNIATGFPDRMVTIGADFLGIEGYGLTEFELGEENGKWPDITISGAGGLDQGVEQVNKWYSIWVIYDPRLNELAGLFSLSKTNPLLPPGFTKKRRVGWVKNGSDGNFVEFTQIGFDCYFTTASPPILSDGNATTYTWVNAAAYIPSTVGVGVFQSKFASNAAGGGALWFRPYTGLATGHKIIWVSGNFGVEVQTLIPLPFSQATFMYKVDASVNAATIAVSGYRDII